MTPENINTIRAQARKCIAEYRAATVGVVGNKDAIGRPIIARHYSMVAPICQPFSLFLITIGRVNGILEDR